MKRRHNKDWKDREIISPDNFKTSLTGENKMNNKDVDILTQCVKAMTLMSDRLDTMFKATEVLQEHIIKQANGSVPDNSVALENVRNISMLEKQIDTADLYISELFNRTDDINRRLDRLEEKPNILTPLTDHERRLDRLEEGLCAIISRRIDKDEDEYYPKPALNHFKAIVKEIYEEQAAAKGDRDE